MSVMSLTNLSEEEGRAIVTALAHGMTIEQVIAGLEWCELNPFMKGGAEGLILEALRRHHKNEAEGRAVPAQEGAAHGQ